MKAWRAKNFPGKRARMSVFLVLITVILVAGVMAFELHRRYIWASETLERIEPRHARLAGMLRVQNELSEALHSSQVRLAEFVHPATEPVEKIGNELQQRVRTLASEYGLSVQNSGVLPLTSGDALDVVAVIMTVQGNAVQLRDLLLAMQRERPVLQLDSVQISMARGRMAAGAFTAQMTVSTMRIKS